MHEKLHFPKTKHFFFVSILYLGLIQLFSLAIPPIGIMAGTPFALPLLIWIESKKLGNPLKQENGFLTMLAFVILGITLDWFFAPGTHDSQGVALIFLMTAAGSVFMFTLGLITVKKMRENARKTFIYPILICFLLLIVPFAWLTFLKSHHNEHLGKTNKTLWEYFS